MKKIVNGKTYNTDTAELIGEISYGTTGTDFRGYDEGLYLSKKGQYFIAGEGGPMSHYAVDIGGNRTSGGSAIRLLSKSEALEWAEENLDTDEILAHFESEIEEG